MASLQRHKVILAYSVLAFVCLASFSGTLDCYYFCDDFNLVSFAYQSYHGTWQNLFQPFISPIESCQKFLLCYRPLPFVFFVLEYKLFSNNPQLFHLSNVLLHIACSCSVFSLTRLLCVRFRLTSSYLIALSAASLFACFPLHVEVVDWCIGVFELLCTLFYLLSLIFFLRWLLFGRPRLFFSCLCFFLALLCKEHAVTVPIICALLWYCTVRMRKRIASKGGLAAIAFSSILFAYLIVRTLVLGNPIGGYVGIANLLIKPFGNGNSITHFLIPLFFPGNRFYFVSESIYFKCLAAIYWIVLCSCLLFLPKHLCQARKQLFLILFFLSWFVLCLLPSLPVLDISADLIGSRQVYLASVPLMGLFSMLIWCVATHIGRRWLVLSSLFITLLLTCVYTKITCINNKAFIQASQQIHSFHDLLISYANLSKNEFCILNPPQRYKGVHLIYHPEMLKAMLSPPFSRNMLWQKLQMPTRFLFLSADLVNIDRIHSLLKSGTSLYFWRDDKLRFDSLRLSDKLSFARDMLPAYKYDAYGKDVFVFAKSEGSFDGDVLEFQYRAVLPPQGSKQNDDLKIVLHWDTPPQFDSLPTLLARPGVADGRWHKVQFWVHESKAWLSAEPVKRLWVSSLGGQVLLGKLSELSRHSERPTLAVIDGKSQDNTEVLSLEGNSVQLRFDASNLRGSKTCQLQICRPGCLFEADKFSYSDGGDKYVGRVIDLSSVRGLVSVGKLLPGQVYEIRLLALDSAGRRLKNFSSPVLFEMR